MKQSQPLCRLPRRVAALLVCLASLCVSTRAADVTFYSYSDSHFGAGKEPMKQSPKVAIIHLLPGTAYPAAIGGQVDPPRAIIMQGDLINDGAVNDKYPTQWADYVADFGVNGEGRCKFPVFEGVGNHDLNGNMFVYNQVKERNLKRKSLGLITNISPNGYHYSWDWDGVHFVNLNLFPGNVWEGEADAYTRGHNPQYARDFLVEDLRKQVGNSGRPVIVVHHFRPIDENWWTYSAADKYHKILQEYNVIAILVGHQGGGVNNTWRGYNWISSNGELVVCRIQGDTLSAVSRSATDWGTPMQKKIFYSYADSGLPAVVNNGTWATQITNTAATLAAKVLYEAVSPTEVTLYWGTTDGGDKAQAWENSRKLGIQKAGEVASAEITGLKPWTAYYYRASASNARGVAWAGASIPFATRGELPAGWQSRFIGYEQRPGSGAHFKDGVFTVRGSGRDIGEGREVDNFEFVYQTLEGDGEIKARLATAEVKSREPKAGLMLREGTGAGAKNVALLLLPRNGVRVSVRNQTDGGSNSARTDARVKGAPVWLKLVRHGITITAQASEDGTTWEPVGEPVTLEMDRKIMAGLAVTSGSRDESKLHTSTFEQVTVSSGGAGR